VNTAENVKTRTCSTCKATESEPLETCSHSYIVLTNKLSPTCGFNGNTGDTACAMCGKVIAKGEVIPATGAHNWGDMVVTTEPTDTSFGIGTHTCLDCGRVKTTVISNYTDAEEIVAAISWNAVYALLNSYLTKA
jgi:hypothetical protein